MSPQLLAIGQYTFIPIFVLWSAQAALENAQLFPGHQEEVWRRCFCVLVLTPAEERW